MSCSGQQLAEEEEEEEDDSDDTKTCLPTNFQTEYPSDIDTSLIIEQLHVGGA